ncbi:MAG: cytochrome C [Deferribacteraceae bacterium]|nr:cytochrome C [Deferribacteraceae bacterium]
MFKTLIPVVIMLSFALFAFAADEHPDDMGNKDCITCHADGDAVSNPKVVAEYNQSIHSYSGVMCGSCHGDVANFSAKPPKAKCEPCHAEQIAKNKSTLPCEACHVVHTFAVHK